MKREETIEKTFSCWDFATKFKVNFWLEKIQTAGKNCAGVSTSKDQVCFFQAIKLCVKLPKV
jgi:hypothetical protein